MSKRQSYITVPGFSQMSLQTIFDTAVEHISITRRQSTKKVGVGGKRCVYSGTGCNAAPFIKPEHRAQADKLQDTHEDSGWSSLVAHSLVPETHQAFMTQLQYCHDNSDPADGQTFIMLWKDAMKSLASRYDLDTTKLDTTKLDTVPVRGRKQ